MNDPITLDMVFKLFFGIMALWFVWGVGHTVGYHKAKYEDNPRWLD